MIVSSTAYQFEDEWLSNPEKYELSYFKSLSTIRINLSFKFGKLKVKMNHPAAPLHKSLSELFTCISRANRDLLYILICSIIQSANLSSVGLKTLVVSRKSDTMLKNTFNQLSKWSSFILVGKKRSDIPLGILQCP